MHRDEEDLRKARELLKYGRGCPMKSFQEQDEGALAEAMALALRGSAAERDVSTLRAVVAAEVTECMASCSPAFVGCLSDPSKASRTAWNRCLADFESCSRRSCDDGRKR